MNNLKEYGTLINPMQLMRLKQSEVQFPTGSYILDDNIEMGYIRVFDTMGKTVPVQMLSDFRVQNDNLCAEVIINDAWNTRMDITEDTKLWIHEIKAYKGYEEWIGPMMAEIFAFANFYGFDEISMSESTYNQWEVVDPEIFSRFHLEQGIYSASLIEGDSGEEEQ